MQTPMTLELCLILLLIFLNGLFAMSEIAIISSRNVRLRQLGERGDRGATRALEMAEQPTRFLSTVQVGMTSIGILSGALGENAIAKPLLPLLQSIPVLEPHAEKLALVITVVLITYLSLIVGELVPKRLALNFPERIAVWMARPMHGLSVLALPLVKALSFSTELVLWVFRVKPNKSEPSITEEEIKLLLTQSTQEGILEEAEYRFIANILKLDERKISSIMTLPHDIIWLDLRKSFEDNRQHILNNGFEVLPLCDGGLENVVGFIKTKDILNNVLLGGQPELDGLKVKALFVPDFLTLLDLLEAFKRAHLHTALVVDEYGDIHGLVTLDDVFEAIVGAWVIGGREEQPEIIQREDGSWLVDGMLDIYQFKEQFGLDDLPEERGGHFHTVGGFVMLHLGRIPKVSEHFELGGLRIEIVDMDGNRVDKVLVSTIA